MAVLLLVSVAGLSRAGTPEAGAATGAGFRDFSFGEPNTLQPTRDKPQSKLWFANGSWWGVLQGSPVEVDGDEETAPANIRHPEQGPTKR